jgi:hypothetical protein
MHARRVGAGVADFNGDGISDIVVAEGSDSNGSAPNGLVGL